MFITLEGIEGSGKTSQIAHIVDFLTDEGYDCVTTREPGGTKAGERIRSILLDPASDDLAADAELLLYIADRVQHLNTFILPRLAAGKTVVCDRFFDATLVYQGYARGLELRLIRRLHQLTCRNIKPDLTFLLDLSPQSGLSRAWAQLNDGSRTGDESRFEQETLDFHNKVRKGYLEVAGTEPERFRIIDGSLAMDQVRQKIISELTRFLNRSDEHF
ncbi:MAG: dTMP kinase [Desulfobacteraceae bacterium]|nr:dTMP kinase [Desulfobacteraceae bacterium]